MIEQQAGRKIQQRNQKIIKIIALEKQQIQAFLKVQFQLFIKRIQKSATSSNRFQQCYQCLSMFLRACFNTMQIYFPILSSSEFISLQYESQTLGRVHQFKNSIFKSFRCLCSKIQLSIEEKKKLKNRAEQIQIKSKRGVNSKTPLENSVVLTEWLLKNFNNPYPSNEQKQKLSQQSGLSVAQVNNWFINSRQRVIKRYMKKDGKQFSKQRKTTLK